jgi:hypothetical protein
MDTKSALALDDVDMDEVPQIQPMRPSIPLTRITLGDLTQRTAVYIYEEMQQLNSALVSMDKELRTLRMRAFVAKSIKKLAQLYAIIRWAQTPAMTPLMDGLAALHQNISAIDAQLAEIQDRYYWSHATMYCMRSRPLEVEVACDILTNGTYTHLPEAIFSCNRALKPGTDFANATESDKAALSEELNTFIRAKLALDDPLPTGLTHASVQNGYLKLRQEHIWEATVSLDHLSETALWVVLSANILIESRHDENFPGGFNHEALERDLLYILRLHAGAARESTMTQKEEDLPAVGSSLANTTSSAVKMEVDEYPSAPTGPPTKLNSNVPEKKNRIFKLKHVQALCNHLSLAAAQRFFYVQGCDLAKTLWIDKLESQYIEELDANYCTFRFWRCKFSQAYQYQVRISHLRSSQRNHDQPLDDKIAKSSGNMHSFGEPLKSEIHAIVLSSVENMADTLIPVQCSGTSSDLNVYDYIANGVTFRRFFEQILYSLATCKLHLLYHRLLHDHTMMAAIKANIIKIDIDDVSVGIQLQNTRLCLCIDAQSGDYTCSLDSQQSLFLKTNYKKESLRKDPPAMLFSVEKFLNEINNLETQRAVREILTDSEISGTFNNFNVLKTFVEKQRVVPLANTAQLMRQMTLAVMEDTWFMDTTEIASSCNGGSMDVTHLRTTGSSTMLPLSFLAKNCGISMENACAQFNLCAYTSVEKLNKKCSQIRPNIHGEITVTESTATTSTNTVGAIATSLGNDYENMYRNDQADIGLFVVLNTDNNFVTRAHIIIAKMDDNGLDADELTSNTSTSFIPRKKSKAAKNLTAGQLFALRAKEEAEEAEHNAKVLEEQRKATSAVVASEQSTAKSIHSFTPKVIAFVPVSQWVVPINALIEKNGSSLEKYLGALIKEVNILTQKWIEPPINLSKELNSPSECCGAITCGSMQAKTSLKNQHNGYVVTYIVDNKHVAVATVAFMSKGGALLEGFYCPDAGKYKNDFYSMGNQLMTETIRSLGSGANSSNSARAPLPLAVSSDLTKCLPYEYDMHRFITTTLFHMHFLWLSLEHMTTISLPAPRHLQVPAPEVFAAGSAPKGGRGKAKETITNAKSIQSFAKTVCFMKPLSLMHNGQTVQYTTHKRVYVDDGLGVVKILREEMAGVVNISSLSSNSNSNIPQWQIECPYGTIATLTAAPVVVEDMSDLCEKVVQLQGL